MPVPQVSAPKEKTGLNTPLFAAYGMTVAKNGKNAVSNGKRTAVPNHLPGALMQAGIGMRKAFTDAWAGQMSFCVFASVQERAG